MSARNAVPPAPTSMEIPVSSLLSIIGALLAACFGFAIRVAQLQTRLNDALKNAEVERTKREELEKQISNGKDLSREQFSKPIQYPLSGIV